MKLQYKGFLKLSVQIAITSITMMLISLFTETDSWSEYFNYSCNNLTERHGFGNHSHSEIEYHWNYRGYVYSLTGFVYFIINVFRIYSSHEGEKF